MELIFAQGMFSPDREPHPAVSEIKYLQQPVTFSFDRDVDVPIDGNSASVVLRAQNRYTFSRFIASELVMASNEQSFYGPHSLRFFRVAEST